MVPRWEPGRASTNVTCVTTKSRILSIRIKCQPSSSGCKGQEPPPSDEGCGKSLAWWFTDEPWRPAKGPEKPKARDVMTKNPKSVTAETLAGDALALLSKDKITALFVVAEGKPVGLLHVHDCLSTGIL